MKANLPITAGNVKRKECQIQKHCLPIIGLVDPSISENPKAVNFARR